MPLVNHKKLFIVRDQGRGYESRSTTKFAHQVANSKSASKLGQASWRSSVNAGSRIRHCPCETIDRFARPSINQIRTGRRWRRDLFILRIVDLFGRERERTRGIDNWTIVREETHLSGDPNVSLRNRFCASEALT